MDKNLIRCIDIRQTIHEPKNKLRGASHLKKLKQIRPQQQNPFVNNQKQLKAEEFKEEIEDGEH